MNNRILYALGWIEVQGKRPTPRISESKLRPAEDLYKLRKELLDQMKDAQGFIWFVFKSSSRDWVDRCSSLIQ